MADQGVVGEAQKSSLAESFCAITASTTETALFFLESHNWNLDSAIHSFFEADEDDHHDALAEEAPSPPPAAEIPRPNIPPPATAIPRPNIPSPLAAPVPNARKSKKASSSGGGGGGPVIRTLADLNRQSGAGSDSDDSDGPAEYYTGGEKSGMLVQDPSKGNHDVDAIFDQVRQMGAMDGPLEHHPSSSSRSFTGTGRLLSGETVAPTPPQRPENVIHDICFWTNGFTVNDGPLRRFDDPENAPFLESIRKSECPKELEPADRRSEVDVNLIRKAEKFPEPPKRSAAFQGVGRTLGGGSASSSAVAQPAVTAAAAPVDLSIGLSVDASLPSTSLQLRLADGTRMVARFNMSHTVGHIRAFIDASRPGASRTYQLQTVGFPPKQLADSTQTIEQAGLANSVIVQKL